MALTQVHLLLWLSTHMHTHTHTLISFFKCELYILSVCWVIQNTLLPRETVEWKACDPAPGAKEPYTATCVSEPPEAYAFSSKACLLALTTLPSAEAWCLLPCWHNKLQFLLVFYVNVQPPLSMGIFRRSRWNKHSPTAPQGWKPLQ